MAFIFGPHKNVPLYLITSLSSKIKATLSKKKIFFCIFFVFLPLAMYCRSGLKKSPLVSFHFPLSPEDCHVVPVRLCGVIPVSSRAVAQVRGQREDDDGVLLRSPQLGVDANAAQQGHRVDALLVTAILVGLLLSGGLGVVVGGEAAAEDDAAAAAVGGRGGGHARGQHSLQ